MKKVSLLVALLCLVSASAFSTTHDETGVTTTESTSQTKDRAYWNQLADGMVQALYDRFWGANFDGFPDRYYFNYGSDMSDMTTFHYWPQAHAMDVVVDAYLRSSDPRYLDIYPLWFIGAPKYNSAKAADPWWNPYVDDMEWIALAQLRMFETTGKKEYYLKAKQLYDDYMWPTWGPEDEAPWYGGITWKTDVNKTKNACSNGPAAIIAARLYALYDQAAPGGEKSKEQYLKEATKIYTWLRDNLYKAEDGGVRDNMNAQGKISPAVYSYNQGTFIGAAYELFRISGNKQYLEEAVNAGNYTVDKMSINKGVLTDAPNGDGGLFHGIFFRYFVKLTNEQAVDKAARKKFHQFISTCAHVLDENGLNHNTMLYGGRWWNAPADSDPVGLTPHLTGCMLIEAMCVLQPVE